MDPEQLRKLFEAIHSKPKFNRKVTRIVLEQEDGVLEEEVELSGLHEGVFKNLRETRRTSLTCGHVAPPAVVCSFADEEFPGPHMACATCNPGQCLGCARPGCSRHLRLIGEQLLCEPCGRVAKLDAIANRVIAATWGILE